jgi:flagellar FliL protein
MAKEPQDKDDESAGGETAGKKGRIGGLISKIIGLVAGPFKAIFSKLLGNKKILIAAVAAVVLLLGGVGYLLLFSGGHEEAKPQAAATEEHKDAASAEKSGEHGEGENPNMPQFVDLPEMTINLVSATGKSQFLRVHVTLEVSDAAAARQIQPVMPRVLDIFQVYMRELRVADIEGSAGVQRLKEELTKRVNQVVTPVHVDGVLFKDMLVQ